MKWRVFLRAIERDVETAECIVKAASCLHNFVMRKNNGEYSAIESEEQAQPVRVLLDTALTNRRSNAAALEIPELFIAYFNR